MPRENFSRRVARAAAVGGGRTYRRQTPVGWYLTLLAICVLGIGLIAYSRYQRLHPAPVVKAAAVPPTKANLWEVGLDADICGKVENLPASGNTAQAFTTVGNGVVTIEPGLASDPSLFSGKNATLNVFLTADGVSLTPTSLSIPAPTTTTTTTTTTVPKGSSSTTTLPAGSSSTTSTTVASKSGSTSTSTTTTTQPSVRYYTDGKTCAGKKAMVETKVWSSPSAKKGHLVRDAGSLRFKDGQLITIAFVPKGTAIPKPPSATLISQFLISNPSGVAPATSGSTLGGGVQRVPARRPSGSRARAGSTADIA